MQVRWRQSHDGVPALDSELRVTVTDDGAVLNVLGAPQHDLEPALEAPRISAAAALRAAGASAAPRTLSAGGGAERTTRFAGGDRASLVVFGEGDSARLAWSVLHRESSTAVWHVAVDAGSGRVLKRTNLVKSIEAEVYERHPGHDPVTVDFGAWLTSVNSLFGPNAVAWSDVDSDDVRDAGENVAAANHPLQPFGAGAELRGSAVHVGPGRPRSRGTSTASRRRSRPSTTSTASTTGSATRSASTSSTRPAGCWSRRSTAPRSPRPTSTTRTCTRRPPAAR